MYHVVGKILIQITERVRILTQALILTSESVASRDSTELFQINDVQSTAKRIDDHLLEGACQVSQVNFLTAMVRRVHYLM